MKKIIHPTDFSENASKALEFAIGLSKLFDAELILLNIGYLPTSMRSSPHLSSFLEMEKEKEASILEQLKSYAANYIKDKDKSSKIQFKVKLNSSTANGLVEAINETDADLVVMGTKGESRLKQIILGSTTKAMVSKAPCPVIAIPDEAIFSEIKQIVYASDFDPNDIAVVKKITAMAQIYNAEISVLHIFNKESERDSAAAAFKQQLTDEVKYSNCKYDSLVSDNVAESLVSYINDNEADLLVFFEKESKGISGLFHKGMVKQFVDHATTIPLMSYNIHSIHKLKD